ncbi:outer membrane protein assembly factor BamB family protein [Streptomyces sp. MUM 178J]|uniref:outer membrane protein assembly factor BamB family protein n=1 Tax=Streptomyces sp. MUM 178J TaxID=2791991 RepID=UPI001F034501|nr:PQQ-binding-like beta-propeller repeat protein [Streptomyces sp. MUM 178J]WRQ79819.1 PQQ-binding-like beta-propeller repeat protein [Streptomyces sp. MUM 178J]
MTQPPNQQPPQGGFGAPQDPPSGAPQPSTGQPPAGPPPAAPPQMPPPPPQGPPQTPPPGQGAPPQNPPQAPGTPPAGPPGYGYPQAPGQPPAQPAGYGYPQAPGPYAQQPPGPYQQPGPYGQQPGPYGGYPTQPQYPGAPTPPGSGKGGFLKGKPAVLIGAAVAALLVVGAGAYFAVSGGDDAKDDKPVAGKSDDAAKPSGSDDAVDEGDGEGTGREADDDLNAGRQDGEAKVLFLTKNDVDLPRNGADVYGLWTVGDTVAKGMYREVAGYSAADGKKKWSVPFDTELCAAPVKTSDDGKIVIAVNDSLGEKAKCNKLQMIDLKTGKKGWTADIPKSTGFFSFSDFTLAISGNTVTAAGTGASYGFSLADGKKLWDKPSDGCKPYAFAGGPKLIAAASCKTSDYKVPQQQVQSVDPATGKPKWTYNTPKGWEVNKVYSVSPLVVSVTHREDKKWSVIALDDNGKLRSQIDGGGDEYDVRCGGSFVVFGQNLEGCTGVAADASTFYMSTKPTKLTRGTNEVVAFDLNTGKAKWRSKAGPERTMTVLKTDGGKVIAYMPASWDRGGAVAAIEASGGDPKVLLQHPTSTAKIENNFYSPKMAYADGRFIIASGRVSARNDEEEKETKTMMAFGN